MTTGTGSVCCFVFSYWLMWVTLDFPNGNFQFGFKSWSDFGPHLSVSQSFILGQNFPSTHPFFPGEPLRYHFLLWFQAANLAFLGMTLVSSINFLSILSMLALVILVMTLAELLFASRAVSRIAALLFFLSKKVFYVELTLTLAAWVRKPALHSFANRSSMSGG